MWLGGIRLGPLTRRRVTTHIYIYFKVIKILNKQTTQYIDKANNNAVKELEVKTQQSQSCKARLVTYVN